MLYPDTPETLDHCKLMGKMNLTTILTPKGILTNPVAAGETSTNIPLKSMKKS